MKKQPARRWTISILTAILSILIVSCGGKPADTADAASKNIPTAASTKQASPSGIAKQEASAETAEVKFKDREGWNFSRYGGWIDGTWDSGILPADIPTAPEGSLTDQTFYKGVDNEALFDNQVGRLYFSDSRFEEWSISFFCDDEQLDALLSEFKANGFSLGMYDDADTTYEFVGGGYYGIVNVRENYTSNNYKYSCYLAVTRPTFGRPRTFRGAEFPQVGVILENFSDKDSYYAYGYDTEGNEVELDYDFLTDKGDLPVQFAVWSTYAGTTAQDAKDWAHGLYNDGWKKTYEYEEEGGYDAGGSKDGIYFRIHYTGYDSLMEAGFASMAEHLDY